MRGACGVTFRRHEDRGSGEDAARSGCGPSRRADVVPGVQSRRQCGGEFHCRTAGRGRGRLPVGRRPRSCEGAAREQPLADGDDAGDEPRAPGDLAERHQGLPAVHLRVRGARSLRTRLHPVRGEAGGASAGSPALPPRHGLRHAGAGSEPFRDRGAASEQPGDSGGRTRGRGRRAGAVDRDRSRRLDRDGHGQPGGHRGPLPDGRPAPPLAGTRRHRGRRRGLRLPHALRGVPHRGLRRAGARVLRARPRDRPGTAAGALVELGRIRVRRERRPGGVRSPAAAGTRFRHRQRAGLAPREPDCAGAGRLAAQERRRLFPRRHANQ